MRIASVIAWISCVLLNACATHRDLPALPSLPAPVRVVALQTLLPGHAEPYFAYCAGDTNCPGVSRLDHTSTAPANSTTPASTESTAPQAPASWPSDLAPSGVTVAFGYRSATLAPEEVTRLRRWLRNHDTVETRYVALVHTSLDGPLSRQLSDGRGGAVREAIHADLPSRPIEIVSVSDPQHRHVVVTTEELARRSLRATSTTAPAFPAPTATLAARPAPPTSDSETGSLP